MKQLLLITLALTTINSSAQKLEVITLDKSRISTTLLDSTSKAELLTRFNGKQDNSIRKKWTARTFQLSNDKVIVEFYDKQALLVENRQDIKRLDQVRFVKNTVDFLKKNVSYKIELGFEKGQQILEVENPNRLERFKSELPEYFDFEVYELNTGQILFLDKTTGHRAATIYPDLKTLSSDNSTVQEELYGSDDDEHLMKKLAAGDRLLDYDVDDHLIYPKYLKDLIENHRLTLVEQKVYVSEFFRNLYRSEGGYYMLIEDVNQENGAGTIMPILCLRVYDSIEQVRQAENRYKESKDKGVASEHFYQQISDQYGQKFPEFVPQLIDTLPAILNIDKDQLTIDSAGMDLIDEALIWHGTNYQLFDSWFPSVLAYYGQCYLQEKQDGKWTTTFDKENKVWIPELKLKDGTSAWDWRDFYKSLYEGPCPIRWAGDWDGQIKKIRK